MKDFLRQRLSQRGSRIHLIGIGGSGMSGVARLLLQHGHRVSGSDQKRGAEADRLINEGVQFFEGHAPENLQGVDLVVFSSAITPQNAERAEADRRGIPSVRRAEALVVLAEQKETIIVAGMHGKTTTSSMASFVLRCADWRPAHYVGAEVPVLGSNAAWGEGHHFVVEGDESDGTVALYHPKHTIILNIEEEHLDYFGTLDRIFSTFAQLIDQTSGKVFYCADDKNAVILCSHRDNAIGYGFSDHARYQVFDVEVKSFSSRFKVRRGDEVLGEITLNVPGRQNVANATGVTALCLEIGVPWHQIAEAMVHFRGARRRFEVKFHSEDFMVVDDYAHHPTEIRATLAAAKNSGWKRILALFQPHRYTRTKLLLNEFTHAFGDATQLFLTEIYASSEKPIEGISGSTLAETVRKGGHAEVDFEPNLNRLRAKVSRILEPGDLVLTMGAGDIHKVATDLAQELKWCHDLKATLKEESVLIRHEPMAKHTTMRIGGPAQLWLEPCDEEDLVKALRYAHANSIPVTFIGRGSNLLVREGGIRGLCVHLSAPYFQRVAISGEVVEAGAGVRLKQLVSEARKHGLGGLEFMDGIPGNLGGALRMNAGAMQGWTMEVVEEIRSIDRDGNVHILNRRDLEVHYRDVPHFADHIAVSARLRGVPADPEAIAEKLKGYNEKRWSSQPAAPSAGCIFKNPGLIPAGKLIDELGLKNAAVNTARVSEVHGNFIVNDGGATATDVLELIDMIQGIALQERGIELETEVIIIGESL